MNYDEAINWLYDLQYFGVKLGLDNTRALLADIGNPQERFDAVHVAGTNGKGSTCAFISSILMATGHRVGTYSSPHLSDFGERMCINGFPMTRDEVARAIGRIRPRVEKLAASEDEKKCTFFETTTAMAFDHFARRRVDIGVVEVGMGGRLDSTNVLEPKVAVITNVSKEHVKHLGKSIRKIATEKAGIIKKGLPTVCGSSDPAVLEVVRERCGELGSELHVVSDEVELDIESQDIYGSTFSISTEQSDIKGVRTKLAGEHQLKNAACAVLAVEVLGTQGIKISGEDIRKGMERTTWPGRLQVVRTSPLTILDATHNPGGARTLARYLKKYFSEKPVGVMGLMEDKDVKAIVKELEGCFSRIIATAPSYHRHMRAETLASYLSGEDVMVLEDVGKAVGGAMGTMDGAMKNAGKGPVVITGSIFTASDALAYLSQLRIKEIMEALAEKYLVGAYPGRDPETDAAPDEEASDPFRVLISTILSQRTRDENTHLAASNLFSKYPDAEKLAHARPGDIEHLIRPAGFYKQKAVKVIEVARIIRDRYGSRVPDDMDELLELPGVGRKTANCVLAYGFRKPAIAVDTHVHRMSNLIGLVRTSAPDDTEMALMDMIPKKYWLEVNRLIVRHGQSICKPVRPRCGDCPISHLCDFGIYWLRPIISSS